MSHTEIIWILGTAGFASTFGIYALIRYIKLHTRPPVNTLVRSGDVELVDYIEPTRHQPNLNYPDLLESHDITSYYYERTSDYGIVPSYRTGTPPSYFTGTPPSFQTIDRWNINCSLENSINLDYTLWEIFILGFLAYLFFLVIKYLIFKYSKTENGTIFTTDISTNVITFTEDYQELLINRLGNNTDYFVTRGEIYYWIFTSKWTIFDVKTWLESLKKQDYAVIIELIPKNTECWSEKDPKVIVCKEFIVNNHSNPVIIATLISKGLENIYFLFNSEIKENHYILIQYTILTTAN